MRNVGVMSILGSDGQMEVENGRVTYVELPILVSFQITAKTSAHDVFLTSGSKWPKIRSS